MLEHNVGAQCWSTMLELNVGAQCWSTMLVHNVGAQCWSTTLGRNVGAQCWSTMLEHNVGAQRWCTMLEHNVGAQCWGTMLEHNVGAQCWSTMLEHNVGAQCHVARQRRGCSSGRGAAAAVGKSLQSNMVYVLRCYVDRPLGLSQSVPIVSRHYQVVGGQSRTCNMRKGRSKYRRWQMLETIAGHTRGDHHVAHYCF